MAKKPKAHKLPVQQLVILSICRFAEPTALTSVFPYLPEMIESFDVPKNEVSEWAGITSAVFSLSQATTGILWGRASDRYGRKPVILCAMFCVMSATLLFGFSRSLVWAVVARSLAGASNGNVGILRTTIAEMVPYKDLQPTAFSVMPLVWTIGSIFGPAFGGALADPAEKYPRVFGNSVFFKKYRFALPNLVASVFFMLGLFTGFLFLKETLETKKHRRDYGRVLGKLMTHPFRRQKSKNSWHRKEEQSAQSLLKHSRLSSSSTVANGSGYQTEGKNKPLATPRYREVFSRQSNINLLTYSILALHSMAYDQILPIFMHYPPQHDRSSNPNVKLPFKFTGGFGIDSGRIGILFTMYGIVGMVIQFSVFPPMARRYGALRCLKVVTMMFPLVYLLTPFTALLPSPLSQQICIFCIMLVKCFAAIFAFPCTTILLTNSAVSLRVLGTLNGVATSISALGRAAGPAITGWAFSIGVSRGFVILPFWLLVGFGILGALSPWWLVEMDGFGGGHEDNENDDDDDDGGFGAQGLHDDEDDSPNATPFNELPLESGEGNDNLAINDSPLPGEPDLSKTVSQPSELDTFSSVRHMSSPRSTKKGAIR